MELLYLSAFLCRLQIWTVAPWQLQTAAGRQQVDDILQQCDCKGSPSYRASSSAQALSAQGATGLCHATSHHAHLYQVPGCWAQGKPGPCHLLHNVACPGLKLYSPLRHEAGHVDKLCYGRVCNVHRIRPLACCLKEGSFHWDNHPGTYGQLPVQALLKRRHVQKLACTLIKMTWALCWMAPKEFTVLFIRCQTVSVLMNPPMMLLTNACFPELAFTTAD